MKKIFLFVYLRFFGTLNLRERRQQIDQVPTGTGRDLSQLVYNSLSDLVPSLSLAAMSLILIEVHIRQ